MTDISACPACAAAPLARQRAAGVEQPTHHLVLPGIHCAGCIKGVEDILSRQPGVRGARVNLTLKRASLTAEPGADPTPWIDALARGGYEAHETNEASPNDDTGRALIVRLGVAGFAMMNVMLLSVAVWSGATDATRDMFHWISAAIAIPAALFAAQPFFANAITALRGGRLNMDVPISLAILLACGMSFYETTQSGAHAYFDAALSLTFFLLAGRVLDARMRRAARSAAADLAALEPTRVTRLEGDTRQSVAVSDVAVDDVIWLPAGARLPVDATLLADAVSLDRSVITGESDPVQRVRGAALQAGEVVLTGPVTVRASAVGEDTTLRRMARLVAVSEGAKNAYTSLADRAAAIYAPLVHLISFAAFLGWAWATGDIRHALNVAIATLIITCPCALGLAVPAVATAATGRLFRRGLLVKSETALERLAEVDTVVFDKTGTLTKTALSVPSVVPEEILPVLKALALASDHPLAKGLARSLEHVDAVGLDGLKETPGDGVTATWHDKPVRLGKSEETTGGTEFSVGSSKWRLEQSEHLIDSAAVTIQSLKDHGLDVHILTGDTPEKASNVADALGVEDVVARMTPEDKTRYITSLQEQGRSVLMIGDGLNDTAALALAHASIAPGSALEASRNAADIVLTSNDLGLITEAITTGRSARKRIIENFGLAASYNAVAIPLALAGFATPLMAALAMSTSSVTVILNAMRVR